MIREERTAPRRQMPWLLRGLWIVFWGIISFVLNFAQAVAEEVAPVLLLLGALWWGLIRIVAALPRLPDVEPYLQYLPERLQAGGYTLTPVGMIELGILLLAVVAACRTVDGIIARRT
ncbi:hypothetical protein IAI18_11055 [Acetobacteraceae bacterium H6797]|nr:hypothetical protein [Acetobacteraceae bacterium H6797]